MTCGLQTARVASRQRSVEMARPRYDARMERKGRVMSFFARMFPSGSIRHLALTPGWLYRNLGAARVLPVAEPGMIRLSVNVENRAAHSHAAFQKLAPSLILSNGTEISLEDIASSTENGFPLDCRARPVRTIAFDEAGDSDVAFLRIRYRDAHRDLPNVFCRGKDA